MGTGLYSDSRYSDNHYCIKATSNPTDLNLNFKALKRKTKTGTNPSPDPNRYRRRCPDSNARIQKFYTLDYIETLLLFVSE